MKKNLIALAVLFVVGVNHANAGDHDPKVIIPLLKGAKTSLLEGIELAEKTSGVATSAKFEVDEGKLILSVYTVPEGLGVEPEKATLSEFGGNVLESPLKASVEVFADKEHIARAAVHMTLFQQSPFSLRKVIELAQKHVAGVPIDIRNPMVRAHRPVADVVIVNQHDEAETVTVDLLTGKTALKL